MKYKRERALPLSFFRHSDACAPRRASNRQPLLAVLFQQFSRPKAPEAGLDPRRRRLNGLLPLSHQEAAYTRLNLRRRFLLERLSGVLPLQEGLLRLRLLPLLLLLSLLLLLTRLLATALRGLLQLLTHAISAEVGLNLRRRRVGLHRVGLPVRNLRHEGGKDR